VGFSEAAGVAVDSEDRVVVFARAAIPVLVFDADGRFIRGWGQGQFERPHGIWIGADDSIYLTDAMGHAIRQYSPDGDLLQTIGPSGEPSDTGIEGLDYRTIRPGAGPFNMPTNLVVGAEGDLFVSDGYGNARVHRFSQDGELKRSWGEPGNEPGQFNLAHGIGADSDGRLYVCDRENSRVQIFSPDGELLSVWTDVVRPSQAFVDPDGQVYVTELGVRSAMFAWNESDPLGIGGRFSIFDREGRVLARWGNGDDPLSAEDFYAPHDVTVDSRGTIYTAEVVVSASGTSGDDIRAFPSLRKFVRVGS
jgi:DNA-binding beta-propeller fold protein YncE